MPPVTSKARKQKQMVMMIVLGIAAAGLCAYQLGPIFFSKPKPKVSTNAPAGGTSSAPKPSATAAKTPAPAGKRAPGKAAAAEPAPEVSGKIDLSAINPRAFKIKWAEFRDPFSPANFEVEETPEEKAVKKLKLEGVIKSADKRLAIISGRVYREGDIILAGYKLLKMTAASVLLFNGEKEIRLTLSATESENK